jgi:transcription initiation factor IIE alpha subunit
MSWGKVGEDHPLATMTVEIVKKIRKAQRLRALLTDKELARRYGITPKAVKDVMARKRWKHVP